MDSDIPVMEVIRNGILVSTLVFLDSDLFFDDDEPEEIAVSTLVFLDSDGGLWGLKFALRGKFSYLNVGDRG